MQPIKKIERKWLDNFKKSPLVDKSTGQFNSSIAHQLFYGKKEESYPAAYPCNFQRFYNECSEIDRTIAIETITDFLGILGINIRTQAIENHLEQFPDDFAKISRKCYYILKTFAHFKENIHVDNPYRDNNGDLYFLLRIESEQSIRGGQLHLFEDLELPVLYNKVTQLPDGYGNNPVVRELFERIENSNDSMFITGKAGTGKSTFIHYLTQNTKKNILLTAYTGIAAINVGGQTIHSFFYFPFKPLMPKDHEIPIFHNNNQKIKLIEKLDTIVIDEISMLRSDILEAIDYSLRKNGGDPDKKFGGKQIIFTGDVFQLPPVVETRDEIAAMLFSEVYKSEYFFDAPAFREVQPACFEFKQSFRQGDDLRFVELLDEVRVCKVSNDTLGELNKRYNPTYTPLDDDFEVNLTATNSIAEAENNRKLVELDYTQFNFEAEISGDFKEDKFPTARILELKKNAQIIFIKNDGYQRRWVNGTIAKIQFISNDLIEIKLQDGTIHKLDRSTWENRKYKYDRSERKIVSQVVGTFTQFPIKLAWAITIHKSQGLTFDRIIIDLGSGAFVNGQLYTALSRCKSLDGVTLKRKIRFEDIINDSRLIEFYNNNLGNN
jgi:ATP-dependent DNA helicase PIF1